MNINKEFLVYFCISFIRLIFENAIKMIDMNQYDFFQKKIVNRRLSFIVYIVSLIDFSLTSD